MLRDIAPGSDSGPSHVVLRTATDVSRLIIRLFFLWSAPRIEVQLDTLPPLHVQHTQQRLEQLHERTIGSWGEIAAGATFVVGAFHAWTRARQWQQLGKVLAAVVVVWVAGQLLEAAWRRARLIWALWRLKRQLVTGKGLYKGSTRPPSNPDYDAAAGGSGAAASAGLAARLLIRAAPRLPSGTPKPEPGPHPEVLLIEQASDIDPVLRKLRHSWRLPRIEVRASGLPDLYLQRTQHRLVQLLGSCNCVLGALFAAVTLLAGGFYILMTTDEFWEWMSTWDTGPGILLTLSVAGAGIAGWGIEAVLTRLRLAAVLRGLRSRLRAEAGGSP